jgi:hypothetical protein
MKSLKQYNKALKDAESGEIVSGITQFETKSFAGDGGGGVYDVISVNPNVFKKRNDKNNT